MSETNRTLDDTLAAVQRFQTKAYVHPLTCRHCDERTDLLRPIARGNQVVMICPTCQGEQVLEPDFLELIVRMSTMQNPLDRLLRDQEDKQEASDA